MLRVNIVSDDNGAGLSRDIRLIAEMCVGAGMEVTISPIPRRRGVRHVLSAVQIFEARCARLRRREQYLFDVNIFIELVRPEWLPFARHNCLIPNQEWYHERWLPYLPAFDAVLCKTRYAQEIFAARGCRTVFTSFTGGDYDDPDCLKDYRAPLHLAGKSRQKGTRVLVDIWRKHPEWPTLYLEQDPSMLEDYGGIANIDYVPRFLGGAELRQVENSHGLHLCPSEAEGFGLYLIEAMATRALIITTDGPPMNELVTPERGLLVDVQRSEPQGQGMNYYVDPAALERKIGEALEMEDAAKARLGREARAWYLDNDRFFRREFIAAIEGL